MKEKIRILSEIKKATDYGNYSTDSRTDGKFNQDGRGTVRIRNVFKPIQQINCKGEADFYRCRVMGRHGGKMD